MIKMFCYNEVLFEVFLFKLKIISESCINVINLNSLVTCEDY